MNIDEFSHKLAEASPLEVPYILMQLEQYDCESSQEMMDRISRKFQKEGIIDNVVTPVFTCIVDAILALPRFKGYTKKLGLTANRVILECKSFNYEGKVIYLQPDSFVEKHNQDCLSEEYGKHSRKSYDRANFENPSEMGRYKKQRIEEAGGRKNLKDEYTEEKNITARKDDPDLRRNDPMNLYNAETDHIIPLKKIFDEETKHNMGLSDGDIKRIANSEFNFALTSRRINNAKRAMSNSDFIAEQDKLKAQGKPYVELTSEQRANMIRMEKVAHQQMENSINDTVIANLLGEGEADRSIRKAAFENKKRELGRNLTKEERASLDKQLGLEKAYGIHKENLKNAGKQTFFYAIGSAILFMIKPIYFEMKDSILNGFKEGVYVESMKEAFKIRFGRVYGYVKDQLSSLKSISSSLLDNLNTLLSSVLEGIIGMFVGIFKQAMRIVKEGIKIMTQSFSVLFGKSSENLTPAEKGDAILKIIGASAAALCGIWIDSMLEKIPAIPEELRGLVSTLCSGLASILVFYLLDKADLFNVNVDRRNTRIKEVFDERINEIRQATESMNEAVIAKMKSHALQSRKIFNDFSLAVGNGDYLTASNEVLVLANQLNLDLGYSDYDNFRNQVSSGTVNWDM